MENPRKLTTRQYVGLVRDLNSRMDQIPPLFQESQKLDESELVDSLANKAPRIHKAMLISQGFNPETRDLETFVEHCQRAETTDNIDGKKFAASDKDRNTTVCGIGSRPQYKDGTDATPLSGESAT